MSSNLQLERKKNQAIFDLVKKGLAYDSEWKQNQMSNPCLCMRCFAFGPFTFGPSKIRQVED